MESGTTQTVAASPYRVAAARFAAERHCDFDMVLSAMLAGADICLDQLNAPEARASCGQKDH